MDQENINVILVKKIFIRVTILKVIYKCLFIVLFRFLKIKENGIYLVSYISITNVTVLVLRSFTDVSKSNPVKNQLSPTILL